MANKKTVDRNLPGGLNGSLRRHSPTRIVFWIFVLIILAMVGAWLGLRTRHNLSAYPGLSPTIPLAIDKSYGVNVNLVDYSQHDRDRALEQMRNLGLSWIRLPFPWAEIESTQGQFDWQAWDETVEAVRSHGLQLIAVLDTSPNWTRPAGTSLNTPPTETSDFGNFAYLLAGRYAGQVSAYQIWHEPNLSSHWGDLYVDPLAYTRLLREGAVNIRAADRDAVIMTATLAPTVETGPLNLNEPEFLAQMYAAGADSWFDVLAAQPYGFSENPAGPVDGNRLNFNRVQLLRQVMVAHGDGEKPIWATSFGWSTPLPEKIETVSPWPAVDNEQQENYTRQALEYARSDWPWMGPMLFEAWDVETLAPDSPRRGLALANGDVLLPQAIALESLDRKNQTAAVGAFPATHPSGQYTGDWRLSPSGADVPRHPPSRLTIQFEGTRLDLGVRRGAFKGFLYVSVDGQPANQLPQQGGRSYVALYDPLEQTDTVTLARFLPDSSHTAVFEADGGWYQWAITGWRVSREADARTEQAGLILVVVLAVVAAGGLVREIGCLPWRRWWDVLEQRYLALGTPVHLVVLAVTAVVFFLAPGTVMSIPFLGLLFLFLLPRPDLGLAGVALCIPFFLVPKPLAGRTISMTELGLLLVAAVYVVRRFKDPDRHWLDWIAWLLTGISALAAMMVFLPSPSAGWAALDWDLATLILVPLAGVLAGVAQNQRIKDGPSATQTTSGQPAVSLLTRIAHSPVAQLDLAVGCLVTLALAASLAAGNMGVAFNEFHVVIWDSAIFYAFIRLTQPLSNRRGQTGPLPAGSHRRLVDAFLLGATLMASYAIYQFFLTDQSITAEGVHRALGVYGSPNNLALLLGRSVPILIAVTFLGWRDREQDRPLRRQPGRIMYALGLLINLVALTLTFSRGALLLGIPAAVLFIGLVQGRRVLALAAAGLAALAAGILPVLGTERLRSLLSFDSGTGFFRLRLWQSAWAMLRDHPWLGVGPDNFLYLYRTRYILPDAWQEPNLSHPHNLVLDFGTRLGIGGVAILVWIQVAFWRLAASVYRRQSPGRQRALLLGLMAAMISILAHGLVDHSFFLLDLAYVFSLILGVVVSMQKTPPLSNDTAESNDAVRIDS